MGKERGTYNSAMMQLYRNTTIEPMWMPALASGRCGTHETACQASMVRKGRALGPNEESFRTSSALARDARQNRPDWMSLARRVRHRDWVNWAYRGRHLDHGPGRGWFAQPYRPAWPLPAGRTNPCSATHVEPLPLIWVSWKLTRMGDARRVGGGEIVWLSLTASGNGNAGSFRERLPLCRPGHSCPQTVIGTGTKSSHALLGQPIAQLETGKGGAAVRRCSGGPGCSGPGLPKLTDLAGLLGLVGAWGFLPCAFLPTGLRLHQSPGPCFATCSAAARNWPCALHDVAISAQSHSAPCTYVQKAVLHASLLSNADSPERLDHGTASMPNSSLGR
jgi:hypothetical protein